MKLERTYQLNTGGNTDFLNMLNRSRLLSKKKSKTEAVQSVAEKIVFSIYQTDSTFQTTNELQLIPDQMLFELLVELPVELPGFE